MIKLISIDPGKKSAIAVWDGPELERVFRLDGMDPEVIYIALETIDRFGDGFHVIVEGQWFRLPTLKNGVKKYHSADFARVSKIIESRSYFVACAKLLGMTTEVIDPGRWIPAMTKGAPGLTADERIKWAAKQRHPDRRLIADEHAAVLLGNFWIERRITCVR